MITSLQHTGFVGHETKYSLSSRIMFGLYLKSLILKHTVLLYTLLIFFQFALFQWPSKSSLCLKSKSSIGLVKVRWPNKSSGHTNLIVCLKAAARVSLNVRINIAKLSKFEFFF